MLPDGNCEGKSRQRLIETRKFVSLGFLDRRRRIANSHSGVDKSIDGGETVWGVHICRISSEMSFPPDAFIIGAQKSATTSLAFLLNQPPVVVLAEPKEPDFLTVNWSKGLDWYRSCFRRGQGILIDASVGYTMAPTATGRESEIVAPARAREISPDAKFIYMVRDPAERCYSAYWHDVRAGRETRSLRQAVDGGAYYVSASYYCRQLEFFLKCFPLDRFLIIRFSDFTHDPATIGNQCLTFLGARPAPFKFITGEPKNESFTYTSFGRRLQSQLGNANLKLLSSLSTALVPARMRPYLKRLVSTSVPALSDEEYGWLRAHFAEDAAAFERLTGVVALE